MVMIKNCLFLIVFVFLVGCEDDEYRPDGSKTSETISIRSWQDKYGKTHEYVFYKANHGDGRIGSMTHYPDCKFCKPEASKLIDAKLLEGK